MTLFRASLLAAPLAGGSLLAAMDPARAEPIEGLYVGAGAGYDLLQDVTATIDALPGRPVGGGSGVSASAPMRVRWGGGYSFVGAVGWGFGNGARLELEGSYRGIEQSGSGPSGGGQQTQFGVMGNALYDVDVGLPWMSPYVGFGLGYQAVTWSHVGGQASGIDVGGGPTTVRIDQTQGGFAYQFIVGVAFPIASVPGLAVTAEYRYLNMAGTRVYQATGSTPASASVFPDSVTRAHVRDDANHSVMVGLRYAFGGSALSPVARPPPAVPAPSASPVPTAQVPARTYLVFFDWDSAELTPRAREVIAEAVRSAAEVAHTRIEVTGHADRTGSRSANQMLSQRRAQVVAGELERRGVPAAAIDIHAAGDTKPLVPTDVGVRQQENRRVEIVYR